MYYLRIYLSRRPLESFLASHSCPWFTQNSLERSGEMQLGPWGNRRRSSAESGGSNGVFGRGGCGGGIGAHLGLVCALFWGREAGGGGAWQRSRAAAAGARAPAKGAARPELHACQASRVC
jgi:hypothetical protein